MLCIVCGWCLLQLFVGASIGVVVFEGSKRLSPLIIAVAAWIGVKIFKGIAGLVGVIQIRTCTGAR